MTGIKLGNGKSKFLANDWKIRIFAFVDPVSSETTYLQDSSGKREDVLSPECGRRQAAIARQSNNGIQDSGRPTNPTNN